MSAPASPPPTAPPTAPPAGRVLVVDDQRNMRVTTAIVLRQAGFEVAEADGGAEALEKLGAEPFDVVLTDLRMGDVDGLEVLRSALEASPSTQVIVMTAFGSIESAVEAVRRGAYDYLAKPFQSDELRVRVEKALEKRRLLGEVSLLAGDFRRRYGLENVVGRSPALREVLDRAIRVAATDATVLLTGESGTGKELVARAIHAGSKRSAHPFVPVNCAAITETLLESELFGHARGAFTGAVRARRGLFEEASGGTLFIDEIGETSPGFQAKLLRALQEGEVRRVGESTAIQVDVRVIAATNQDLHRAIAEKRFREDLFYRLNVVPLRIPPLRERREDIPLLARHFLDRLNRRGGGNRRWTVEALARMLEHDWPGNVRELENVVEQAAALCDGRDIQASDVSFGPDARNASPGPGVTLADAVAAAERRAIEAALVRCGGDQARVARELGVSATTLWRKMKRLGVESPAASSS